MSGAAPVFDTDAHVRGMAVATLTRTIPELDGNDTVKRNGIVLEVEHVRAFIEHHGLSCASAG
jgi:hypothetical protein